MTQDDLVAQLSDLLGPTVGTPLLDVLPRLLETITRGGVEDGETHDQWVVASGTGPDDDATLDLVRLFADGDPEDPEGGAYILDVGVQITTEPPVPPVETTWGATVGQEPPPDDPGHFERRTREQWIADARDPLTDGTDRRITGFDVSG